MNLFTFNGGYPKRIGRIGEFSRIFGLQPGYEGAPTFRVQVLCQLPTLPASSSPHRRLRF